MQIEYLADHLDAVSLLADWHHGEWNEFSFEATVDELRTHTGRRQIPTTFVAIDQGRVIGSTSLLAADLIGWEHLTPWVASVFVVPDCRRRGVGRALVEHAVREARLMDVPSVYLFTASKEAYYARLGWKPIQRAQYRSKKIVIMQRRLRPSGEGGEMQADERAILEQLDALVSTSAIRAYLVEVAQRVAKQLSQDTASVMAWESLPLTIYSDSLPSFIHSSWIFVLRASTTTGAERHPNSHQRMMSLCGAGDIQTGGEERWQSHRLVSDENAALLQKWASIPPNVWHQAVVPDRNWTVVSFHTALAHELIEERSDGDATRQRLYLGD